MITDFENFKRRRYRTWSDIVDHLPFLEFLSRECSSVTEFGVRDACSTAAFISGCAGKGRVISYDINRSQAIDFLESIELPCKWKFIQGSTVDESLQIEETDLLFIDTLHHFSHVETELRLHGHKAKRWIAFHDTASQGIASVDVPGEEGINRAINEYIQRTGAWKKVYEVNFNNGLTLIERIGS